MNSSRTRAASPLAAALLAAALVACSPASTPSSDASATPQPSESRELAALVVTSPDFEHDGALDPRFSANAFGGQCQGQNVNPGLEWSGAPEGTETFAIALIDRSASDWEHWVHVNIPGDVNVLPVAGSESLPGLPGRHQNGGTGYFGPCAPATSSHRYEFTVWALDSAMEEGGRAPSYSELLAFAEEHALATGSITGRYPAPAE